MRVGGVEWTGRATREVNFYKCRWRFHSKDTPLKYWPGGEGELQYSLETGRTNRKECYIGIADKICICI